MSTNITLEQAVTRLRCVEAEVVKTQQVIASLLRPDKKEYVDDHNSGERVQVLDDSWVLVEWNNKVCPFRKKGGACLNPLYISQVDGRVHLDKWSIGPYFPDVAALDEALVKYYTI